MIAFNVKTAIGLFIIGLLIGFFASFLFQGCGKAYTKETAPIIQPETLKRQAVNIEAYHEKKIAYLEKQNQQLQQDLKTTRSALKLAKQATQARTQKIKQLVKAEGQTIGYSAKQLLQKVKPGGQTDTTVSPCDSLVREVTAFFQETSVKDSLYEIQIQKMDSVVSIKDSIIENHQQAYHSLNQLFAQAVDQQDMLLKENKRLCRKVKRQKFRSSLKTIGVMVLTGAATNYILSH